MKFSPADVLVWLHKVAGKHGNTIDGDYSRAALDMCVLGQGDREKLDKILAQQAMILAQLQAISRQESNVITDVKTAVAAIAAQTDILKSIRAAEDQITGGQGTVADEVAALKKQIADQGAAVDFTALDAAVKNQGDLIGQVGDAIVAGTTLTGPAPAAAPAGA